MITDPKEGERYVVRGADPTFNDAGRSCASPAVDGEIVTVREDGIDRDGDVRISCAEDTYAYISPEFLFPIHNAAKITVADLGPARLNLEVTAVVRSFVFELRTRDGAVLGTYTHEVTP